MHTCKVGTLDCANVYNVLDIILVSITVKIVQFYFVFPKLFIKIVRAKPCYTGVVLGE